MIIAVRIEILCRAILPWDWAYWSLRARLSGWGGLVAVEASGCAGHTEGVAAPVLSCRWRKLLKNLEVSRFHHELLFLNFKSLGIHMLTIGDFIVSKIQTGLSNLKVLHAVAAQVCLLKSFSSLYLCQAASWSWVRGFFWLLCFVIFLRSSPRSLFLFRFWWISIDLLLRGLLHS